MTSCRCLRPAWLPILTLLLAGQAPASGQTSSTSEPGSPPASSEIDAESRISASVLPARSFGFTLGDVLLQSIPLPEGYQTTELSELSDAARISTWLERQDAVISSGSDGDQILTVRYQIVNSPTSIIMAALPELSLTAAPSLTETVMLVPAWPFTLGPITIGPLFIDTDTPAASGPAVNGIPLQADMTLSALDEATPATRLHLALLMLGSTLALWSGWYLWRHHRDKDRLPFAQASHALKSREKGKADDPDRPWKTLHHAFNQSAGHVVNASSIDALLNRHDWLRPLESRIRAFYDASAARHFALPARDEPFALEELARELAHCEISNCR